MERHEENEAAAAPAAENPFESMFDDEFAVHTPEPSIYEFNGVNRLREEAETSTTSRPRPSGGSPPRRSTSLSARKESPAATAYSTQPTTVRSSIAKNRDWLPTDSSRGPMPSRVSRVIAESTPRYSSDSPRRSSSRASSYAPYEGSSSSSLNGPSHPYGMYPQTGVPRSASTATSSTVRHPPSTAQSITPPSHPYGLYQQNSLPIADDDSTAETVPPIQIGFPGRNAEFYRPMGPDGEDQDIIGPDGHTEQLPPYTKYPEEHEKVYAAGAVATSSPSTPSTESQTTLVPSPSRALQTTEEPPRSDSTMSEPTVAASEKSWHEKNWREKRKTKICGIPVWLVLVAFGCLVFVSVVIGGAIGGFLAHERAEKHSHHSSQNSNTASMIDATSIPSPTGLPPFPTGLFYLPLGEPQETEQNCLTNPTQLKTWSCNVVAPPLMIDTETASDGDSIAQLYPEPLPPNFPKYQYGPQPPTVLAQKLLFVDDLGESQLGPALHFQTVYDKLVILDPDALSAPAKKRRGDAPPAPTDSLGVFEPSATLNEAPSGLPHKGRHNPKPSALPLRKTTVQAGDQPWFCFWNSTFIEAFIYVTQPIPMNNASNTSASTTAGNGSPQSTSASDNGGQASTSTTFATSVTPSSITTTFPMTKPSSISIREGKRDTHIKDADDPRQFPYLVKVSERRLQQPPVRPYCQKMNINSDGSVTTYLSNGQPVVVYLSEQDPSDAAFESAAASPIKSSASSAATGTSRRLGRRALDADHVEESWQAKERSEKEWDILDEVFWKREDPDTSCACQWMAS